ncbi:MAG TPA: hypothetical protein VEB19_06370 [Gemmatimonadaceae bacterium]|nr:hypothetical protein [Gemmatimonadaceae bacterium]
MPIGFSHRSFEDHRSICPRTLRRVWWCDHHREGRNGNRSGDAERNARRTARDADARRVAGGAGVADAFRIRSDAAHRAASDACDTRGAAR